jgi:hypothetical protein
VRSTARRTASGIAVFAGARVARFAGARFRCAVAEGFRFELAETGLRERALEVLFEDPVATGGQS